MASNSNSMSDLTFAIIGGTGNTGKWAVKAALQRGAKARVLCRSPEKLKTIYATLWKDDGEPSNDDDLSYDKVIKSGQLTIVQGSIPIGNKGDDVFSANSDSYEASIEQKTALKELITGSTHVMSFLGMDPNSLAPVCRPGIAAIMEATRDVGSEEGSSASSTAAPPKILIMSSLILSDSYAQGKAAWGCCGSMGYCMRWKILRAVFDDMEAAEQYGFEHRTRMGLDVSFLRATVLGDRKNYFLGYDDASSTTDGGNSAKKYFVVKSDELKKVTLRIDRQHVVQCFMDVAADREQKMFGSNTEWSIFDA